MRNQVADSSAFIGILQISRNSRWCGDFAGSDEGIRVVEDCLAERVRFELTGDFQQLRQQQATQ
jgi:hypothetical protein